MNKNVLKLLVPFFALILLSSVVSAYYYDDYKREYAVKEKWDDYGYSFYEKNSQKNPWGEKTTYTKIKDYDSYRSSYRNRALDYWDSGDRGYSRTYKVINTYGDDWRHLGYRWNDDYKRGYPTQYTDYYYHPRYFYNGDYYNWEGDEPHCANDRSGRWSSVSYCGSNIYHYSW